MNWRVIILLVFSVVWLDAAEARILKVLPHLLDEEGRHTLSPSLYERDAYQVHLRENEELISALRFDIQYKGPRPAPADLTMKIEIRGSGTGLAETETFAAEVQPTGWLAQWAAIVLSREDYDRVGEIIAWRVTLWSGGLIVAEQESFLW